MREVAAEFERPVLLFSGGKDSIVLLRLAEKAFRPAPFPFPLMHVDTGHNFPEVIEFRDRRVAELGERLIVASVQDSIDSGPRGRGDRAARVAQPAADRRRCSTRSPSTASTPRSAAPAATRSAPAPRSASSASATTSASGTPSTSAPSCGTSTTGASARGEHVRVFPISNWTELDVWEYIDREAARGPLDLLRPPARGVQARRHALRLPRRRRADRRRGASFTETVRYRTVGDMSCTGGVRSDAATLEEVVAEIAATRITERGETRADDRVSEAAMEDRKKAGYF